MTISSTPSPTRRETDVRGIEDGARAEGVKAGKLTSTCSRCQLAECKCAERMTKALMVGVPIEKVIQGLSMKESPEETSRKNACLDVAGLSSTAAQVATGPAAVTSTLPPLSHAERLAQAVIKA